ncbi:hypothetical protein G4B88_023459, partial [Cannabis sativa]
VKTTRLFYYGLKNTTATYTTNFLNLIPIVTFVVSVIIRMERLRLGSKEGKVKTIGALLCVSGALLTALHKGNEFFISNHHSDHHSPIITSHPHWTRGTIILLASTLAYSSWFIVQVKLQKQLPFVYLSTMLPCILSSFQSVILGLWNISNSVIVLTFMGHISSRPTYPPMFNPLALIFVALVSEVNKCNKNVWFWLFCNALAGLERLNLDTKGGKVKCIGALMCVGGALTTSLYKGKAYYIISHHHHHDHTTNHSHIIPNTTHTNWPLGTLMLVKLKQIFPYKYWSTMLTCLIGALQSAIVGLCLDRSVASWRLGWNLQLITIIYSGSLATAATFCLLTWAISIKGATYPSMFNPLTLIFVSLSEAIILGVAITTGTLIGMVLIIFGLYSFLWGNRKETKSLKWFLWSSQVVIGMLLVQAFLTGMQILSRVILGEGTFVFALMTYRYLVAALCVAPLAFYFERVACMGLFHYGLRDTTATYATNFLNLVPIVTFVLSILLRLERLNLHTKGGKMKCIGALMCGALGTAATFCLLTWAISIKGATYPSMFNSLGLIFVSLSEAVILGVAITTGIIYQIKSLILTKIYITIYFKSYILSKIIIKKRHLLMIDTIWKA